MPALGTHSAMTEAQLRMMFGDSIPLARFKVHDWRNGIRQVGKVPGKLIREWSEGLVDYDVLVQVSNHLFAGYDLILSVGQIVPHEVVGMANYTKNIVVGAGGADMINKSHFLGAAYGMERMMGRIETPVRRLFNYAVEHFLRDLPIQFVLTVMEKNKAGSGMIMRGLYVGDDMETFTLGSRLSQKVNLDLLDQPLKKVVVYLDPHEFKSTWLGNKAVYRTRMVMADGGELIILAPGLKEFGEDAEIDRLIRKYGYRGTPATLAAVKANADLRNNLSAAAHLIHGSSEGRFRITYCPGLRREPRGNSVRGLRGRRPRSGAQALPPRQAQGRPQPPARRRGAFLHQQPRPRPLGAQKPVRRIGHPFAFEARIFLSFSCGIRVSAPDRTGWGWHSSL